MQVHQFVDEGLGNSAHLVVSERAGVAALIDPERDVDRYLDAAAAMGVRITHVCETHVHNDFISGGRELAARTGARLVAGAAAGLAFDHQPVADGERLMVGDVQLTALATPGHTPEHVAYLARDLAAPATPAALFSGGSLLVGAVSRTDLLGDAHTEALARDLYRSLHEKILVLPDDVAVYPTHGAGSFCTAAAGGERSTTIGRERRTNPLLQLQSVEAFTHALSGMMPAYPAYFRFMRAINLQGPPLLGRLPDLRPLPARDVWERLARGDAVVDLRPVARYVAGHIPGVYHVELRPAFASWVGWVVPFGTPIVLVSETPAVHEEAVRQLLRIGYDDLPGYLDGGMAAWARAGLPVARTAVLTARELHARLSQGEPPLVLDVRRDDEWRAGHIPGAVHVEAGALAQPGIDPPVPETGVVAVHCGHDARAATALSLLERRGRRNAALVAGGFGAWEQAGLPIARDADIGVLMPTER